MLQCIDVVIYHVRMDRRAVMRKTIRNSKLRIITMVSVGIVQTFRLGVLWMIAWYFTNSLDRHSYTLVVQVSDGFCSGGLSSTKTKGNMFFRHGFLPCRVLLLVYLHGSQSNQEYRTDIINQSLHLLPF